MSGLTCGACGQQFFPQTSAWGEGMCGDCIALGIEFSLLLAAGAMERKPARRSVLRAVPDAVEYGLAAMAKRYASGGSVAPWRPEPDR